MRPALPWALSQQSVQSTWACLAPHSTARGFSCDTSPSLISYTGVLSRARPWPRCLQATSHHSTADCSVASKAPRHLCCHLQTHVHMSNRKEVANLLSTDTDWFTECRVTTKSEFTGQSCTASTGSSHYLHMLQIKYVAHPAALTINAAHALCQGL